MKVDCIVIGAGPAGSVAAKEFAERGLDTLVVEKKAEIGPPKRCAEGVSQRGLEILDITPCPQSIARVITGAALYAPSGKAVFMEGPGIDGYVLERKIFEKQLASDAIKSGARYMIKTQALAMERNAGGWTVMLRSLNGDETVTAPLVIGADGVESKVGRWAGLKAINRITDYHSGFQYEMANVNINMDYIHMFFGTEVAPLGYAWVFPKTFSANVGLGILERGASQHSHQYLDQFIIGHPEFFANASPLEINAGGVPVNQFTQMVADGVMLVGDAAQLVNPIHGGGIVRAMHSSQMAAEIGATAINNSNTSADQLLPYLQRWNEEYGEKTDKLLKLRFFLEKLTDKNFELLASILEGVDIYELTQAHLSFFIKKVLRHPSLLGLVKKYLKD
jgi:digeranylgeranylglycerophospholipid reductase